VLFHQHPELHSTLHCWRHKSAIIYRAPRMVRRMRRCPGFRRAAAETLRATALRCVEATTFYPTGKARLHGMIANRPDWTLSRQRQWGVPMPLFIHKETRELHPRTLELWRRLRGKSNSPASSVQQLDARELLGADADHYEKIRERSTSGSTRLDPRNGAARLAQGRAAVPADLYLEGSDQHRGCSTRRCWCRAC